MARIDRYTRDTDITGQDVLLGQDSETGATVQYPLEDLATFFGVAAGSVRITNVEYDDTTGQLTFTYDDGNTFVTPDIRGEQGIRGLQGVPGPVGATGAAGRDGAPGDTGPEGPEGPEGPMGSDGPAGPRGVRGPQGDQGVEGPVGPAGPQGDIGPQGIPGPRGEQGLPGAQGADGQVGPRGPQGRDGARGPQGDEGPTGPQGLQGPAGPQGPQGIQGERGLQGPQGAEGDTGPAGPAGPRGEHGLRGLQGIPGAPGADGRDGVDGSDGAIGPRGPQGEQGLPGPQGNVGAQGLRGERGESGLRYNFNDRGNNLTEGLAGVQFDFTGTQNQNVFAYVDLNDFGFDFENLGVTIQDTDVDPAFEQTNVRTINFTGQGVDPIFVDPNNPTRVIVNIPGVSSTGQVLPTLTGLMPGITGFDSTVFNDVRQDLTFTPTWVLNTRGYPMARVTEVHLFDGDRNQITSQVGTDAITSGSVSLGAPSQNFENGPLTFIVQVRVQDLTNPTDVDFTMEVMRTLTVNQPTTPGALTINASHNFSNTTDAQFNAGFVERHDSGTITYVVNIPDPGEWEWEPTVSFTLNGRTLTDTIDTNTRTNGGTFQTSSTSGDKTVNQDLSVTLTYRQPLRPSNGGSRSVESLHRIQRSFRAGSIRTTSTIDLTTLQDLDTTGDNWNIITFGTTNFPTSEINVEVQGETSLRAGDGERLVFVLDENETGLNQITIGGIGTVANFSTTTIDGYRLWIQNNSSSGTRTFGITLS